MTRATDPQPGMVAQWSGWCDRCGGPVVRGVSRIYFHRGNPVHVECASGADDE
jgi:hypothetical protein